MESKNMVTKYEKLVDKVMENEAFKKAVMGQIEYLKYEGFQTKQSPLSENGTIAVVVVKARNNLGVGMNEQPEIQSDMDEISRLYDEINPSGALEKRMNRKKSNKRGKSKPSKKSKKSKPSKKGKSSKKNRSNKNRSNKNRSNKKRRRSNKKTHRRY